MHVLQWLAVEAENEENATDLVEAELEATDGEWFDWYVVGGGRYFNDSEDMHKSYEMSYDNTISASKDSDIINKVISWEQARHEEYGHLVEGLDINKVQAGISAYDKDKKMDETIEFATHAYKAMGAIKHILGYWTPDSVVYDLTQWTSDTKYIHKRLETKLDKQFFVPVDFHF